MDLPQRPEDWTFDTVVTVVKEHDFEPSRFDFKEVLNSIGPGQEQHTSSIRKTVCAMANAGVAT